MLLDLLQKKKTTGFKNAAFVQSMTDLDAIHDRTKNIAIYERDVDQMQEEVNTLLSKNFELRLSGSKGEIQMQLTNLLSENKINAPLLRDDAIKLLNAFEEITSARSFRLNLLTVNTNMCRRFHTDINDLRLLCTYSGPGTLWLPEEAADRNRHHYGGDNEEIVKKPKLIQQAKEGDVVILKGALYPEAKAAIHRSPSVEESGEKRLLIRIDTNESLI